MENLTHMTDLTSLSAQELRAYVKTAQQRKDSEAFMDGLDELDHRQTGTKDPVTCYVGINGPYTLEEGGQFAN